MRALIPVVLLLLGASVYVGLVIETAVPQNAAREACSPPSSRSVESLFAPCLAKRPQPQELETVGQR